MSAIMEISANRLPFRILSLSAKKYPLKFIFQPNFRSWEDSLRMVPQFDFIELKGKGDVGYIEIKSSKCQSKYLFYIVGKIQLKLLYNFISLKSYRHSIYLL